MGEGYGHRIGGVVRWRIIEAEESNDHEHDLLFLGTTMADDRGLDLGWTIGFDRELVRSENGQNHATALRQREARLRVDAGKRRFHRSTVGREIVHQRDEPVVKICEAVLAVAATGTDHTGRFKAVAIPLGNHERPSGGPGTGIDAENADALCRFFHPKIAEI